MVILANEFQFTHTPLKELSSQQVKDYRDTIENSPQATVYHTLEWNRIVTKYSGVESKVALIYKSEKPIGSYLYYLEKTGPGHIVKSLKSPYQKLESHYGGPISLDGNPLVIQSLLNHVEMEESPGIISLKLSPESGVDPYLNSGYEIREGKTAYIDLSRDQEILWSNMSKSTRKNIKKAENNQISIRKNRADTADIYSRIAIESAERSEISPLPEEYFKELFEIMSRINKCIILIAKMNDDCIAGAFYLMHRDTVYSWHSCSKTEHRSTGANPLIKWEFIKLAKESSYTKYDLMGLDVPSIAKYKLGFSGTEVLLHSAVKKKGMLALKNKLRSG